MTLCFKTSLCLSSSTHSSWGQDVAGTVEDVGSTAASRSKVGDRVSGFSINNGFKSFVTLNHDPGCQGPGIPVLQRRFGLSPLRHHLRISSFRKGLPSFTFPCPPLILLVRANLSLIWGGSSAVGSNAIQPAKAAGFEVVTTYSPQRFIYVKSLGASKIFDYNSPSVTDDVCGRA